MSTSEHQEFREDCLAILREGSEGKRVHRRRFLQAIAALGVVPAGLRFTPAHAAASEVVVVNWGGDAVPAYDDIWAKPFSAANAGVKAVINGAGPTSGKIKAMVESRAVTWDVCDRTMPASLELGRQNLLEQVDWNIVAYNKLRPAHRSDWGVGAYLYSFALTYDREALKGATPKSWADFWNVKDFPGKRTLRNNIEGMLEAALMADGVAPDKIYPINVDRALDKIKQIKQHTIFWSTGAESQQLFRNKEVVMGNLWHTRSMLLAKEVGDRIQFTFDQGVLFAGAWIVPKGNPAGPLAWKFIASAQDPQSQVELFKRVGNGPINPAASALVPAELKALDCGSPENFAKQVIVDAEWYAEHYAAALNRYMDVIAS
ncbi:ABC transporter substrate-binding protein [Phreatobacter sp. AB_2022a]|uniref:ABC transporter substrate-binding protein n=1 Tax=Phreatobacter sp. AB_2022a TaxID=3003134 RepID=UPI002286DC37|nr:ABC transporter substrate-binding protein [Phreatobacter sp. AB_2022a]MCZ0735852.1 ABC transporter substrate-binding protein [Phreatobacter sp. AB_2022a]